MSYGRWTWPVGVLLGVAGSVGVALWGNAPVVVADGPLVQITAPPSGFKLRSGQTMLVRIRVQAGERPLREWTLRLVGPEGRTEKLAAGAEPVGDSVVARVEADTLQGGETYRLRVEATDIAGGSVTKDATFQIPAPLYSLIPLDAGNMSLVVQGGKSIDGAGKIVTIGGQQFGELEVLRTITGHREPIHIPLKATDAFQLSGDGERLVFAGGGARPPLHSFALGFFELATGRITQVPLEPSQFLSADRRGRRCCQTRPWP